MQDLSSLRPAMLGQAVGCPSLPLAFKTRSRMSRSSRCAQSASISDLRLSSFLMSNPRRKDSDANSFWIIASSSNFTKALRCCCPPHLREAHAIRLVPCGRCTWYSTQQLLLSTLTSTSVIQTQVDFMHPLRALPHELLRDHPRSAGTTRRPRPVSTPFMSLRLACNCKAHETQSLMASMSLFFKCQRKS